MAKFPLRFLKSDLEANVTIKLSITLLSYAGFWIPRTTERWKLVFYRIYTILSFVFILGIYLVVQATDLWMVRGDLNLMTSDAFLLLTNLAQTAKLSVILMKHDKIRSILNDFQNLLCIEAIPEKMNILKRYGKSSIKHFCFYSCLTCVTVTLWALYPVMAQQSRVLPLNAWYPYRTDLSPTYELTYTHQMVAIYIAAALNVVKDTLITCFMSQISCQLELLKYDLTHLTISQQTVDKTNYPELEFKRNYSTLASDAIPCERLKKCIVHHQKILELRKQIEDCFSKTVFIQLSVSLFIICVSAFQLAQLIREGNTIQTFGIGVYLCDMMFQVFLYCWHGNEVIVQSQDVMMSAFSCKWYKCSKNFNNNLKKLMQQTVKPVYFTAGGFAKLSIEAFTAIIKASYSFFTLLQHMNDTNKK